MKNLKFTALLFNVVMALLIGSAGSAFGLNAYAVAGTVFAGGVAVNHFVPQASALMAIQVELWQADIVANLFKANPFMNYAFNGDQYVLAGKVVHIPNAGGKPSVTKNRSSLPASITKRTDSDVTYALAEYTTDPTLIPDADTVELSYDKRQSVITEHAETLFETVGDWMLYDWFTSLNSAGSGQVTGGIVRTSGGDVLAHTTSATGNRKKLLKDDIKAAAVLMNKQNIAKDGRYCILDSEMYAQLMDDADLIKRDGSFGGEVNLKEGVVMKLYGFNIMERSSVLTFTNAGTPAVKAPGASGATTDNAGALCWQQNSVERALGEVKFFENPGVAEYYGDIYSALLRAGGRLRRAAGVVAIVQAAGS
jgi:hypothetical protein